MLLLHAVLAMETFQILTLSSIRDNTTHIWSYLWGVCRYSCKTPFQ